MGSYSSVNFFLLIFVSRFLTLGGRSSNGSSLSMGITSSVDSTVDLAPGAAKSGAGGSGRLGLPPYLDEGVPGRGLPLRSDGSYGTFDGGGLVQSMDAVEFLEGVFGLIGDPRSGDTCRATAGGGIAGAGPRLEDGLELFNEIDDADGR